LDVVSGRHLPDETVESDRSETEWSIQVLETSDVVQFQ